MSTLPLYLHKIDNQTGEDLTVTLDSSFSVDNNDTTRLYPLAYTPTTDPQAEDMTKLTLSFGSEEQTLHISYDIDDLSRVTVYQRDNNGTLGIPEVSGSYNLGDLEINLVMEGGIILIGTVDVDIEPPTRLASGPLRGAGGSIETGLQG